MNRTAWNILATLVLCGFCLPADAAISLVTHKSAKDLTGAESTALAAPGYASAAGNFIAVWVVTYSGGEPVGVVSDSAGNTYKPATLRTGTWNGQWFYATNIKGDDFNVITIRPRTTGRATFKYPAMIVLEYSGVDKNAVLATDTAGQQGSLTGGWNSSPFDVSSGELVLVGVVTANGGQYTAGSGFTMQDSYSVPTSSRFSFAAFDQLFTSTRSGATANISWTGTFQTTGAVVSFKPAT